MTELTVENALDGTLRADDLRLSAATLIGQARRAEDDGNPQLGRNFRRAAELVDLPDDRVLAVYEALRPSRSSATELTAVAAALADGDAPLCAELVREAAAVYARRGLLRP